MVTHKLLLLTFTRLRAFQCKYLVRRSRTITLLRVRARRQSAGVRFAPMISRRNEPNDLGKGQRFYKFVFASTNDIFSRLLFGTVRISAERCFWQDLQTIRETNETENRRFARNIYVIIITYWLFFNFSTISRTRDSYRIRTRIPK